MATYQLLNTLPLEVEFVGGNVDLVSLGVTCISLQRITEKVVHDLLASERVLTTGWRRRGYPTRWLWPEYPRFVQLEVTEAKAGSFQSALTFTILSALADPHVIAILENLSANVLWAIGASGIRGITRELKSRLPTPPKLQRQDNDPFHVQSLVRDIILVAGQSDNVKAIRFKSSNAGQITLGY